MAELDSYGHFYSPSSDEAISNNFFPSSAPETPSLKILRPTESPSWSDDDSGLDKSFASEASEYEIFKPFVTDVEHRPFHNRIERVVSLILVVVFISIMATVDYYHNFQFQKFVVTNFLQNRNK